MKTATENEVVVLESADSPAIRPIQKQSDRSIGTILIQAGRLTFEEAESILQLQRDHGMRFGDAALKLGLLTEDDINYAIAHQFGHQYLISGQSNVSESVVCAYAPFGQQAQQLSALRSQLLLRWFDSDPAHHVLAIISAERREGRSFIAANLSVSFSQLGKKTLLIDADMRHPVQDALFGLDNRNGLSAMLSNRGAADELIQSVPGLPDLSILTSGVAPPNPLELLARPLFPQLLADFAQRYDIVILDTPSATECSDSQTVAMCARAAIIAARKNVTRVWKVRGVSETLAHASTTILGTVLNDF